MFVPNFVFLARPSLQILGKPRRGYFRFPDDDIDMKLGPVTKLDKRNKATSRKFDNDVMLGNCDIIVIFPTYG